MPEVKYVSQGNKRILLIDLVSVSDYRMLPSLVAEAISAVRTAEGLGSVRTLIDLTDTRVNKYVVSSLKDLSRSNGRYAKATAFVGLSRTWSLVFSALLLAGGKRNHKVIRSRSNALLWLERQ
jgi:hypothetical protein